MYFKPTILFRSHGGGEINAKIIQNVNELPSVLESSSTNTNQEITSLVLGRNSFMSKKGKHKGKKGNHKTSGSANGQNGYH
ncbi:hypothetical protein [Peribacillus simplex]|uniref:hypothetical protein n=1 Tax=Peribacillus simplex TaxID=1478 RepID=UPI00367240C3